MGTYSSAIKELKGFSNTTEQGILFYIAQKKQCLENNAIQYRKLYYRVIRPALLALRQNNHIPYRISRRQFKKTYISRDGRFPLEMCFYLLGIYMILIQLRNQAPAEKINIQYSEFIAGRVFSAMDIIVQDDPDGYTWAQLDEFRYILNRRDILDAQVGCPW